MAVTGSHGALTVPKSPPPPWGKIILGNGILLFFIWFALALVWFKVYPQRGIALSIFTTLFASGLLVQSGVFGIDVADRKGLSLFDPIFRTRRTLYPGFHPKVFWERPEGEISLINEVKSEETENFETSIDGMSMDARILIHAHVNTETGNPADNLILFQGIDESSMRDVVRAEIVKKFDRYYAKHTPQDLRDADAVEKAITKDPEYRQVLEKLNNRYGSHTEVVLKWSRPDARTIKLMETRARVAVFNDSMKGMENNGLDAEVNRNTVMLLDDTAEYSEFGFRAKVQGLEHAQSVAVTLTPGMMGKGGAKGGKGGKK